MRLRLNETETHSRETRLTHSVIYSTFMFGTDRLKLYGDYVFSVCYVCVDAKGFSFLIVSDFSSTVYALPCTASL